MFLYSSRFDFLFYEILWLLFFLLSPCRLISDRNDQLISITTHCCPLSSLHPCEPVLQTVFVLGDQFVYCKLSGWELIEGGPAIFLPYSTTIRVHYACFFHQPVSIGQPLVITALSRAGERTFVCKSPAGSFLNSIQQNQSSPDEYWLKVNNTKLDIWGCFSLQCILSHLQMRKRHEDDAGWAWVVGGGCYIKGNARMHHYLHSEQWVLHFTLWVLQRESNTCMHHLLVCTALSYDAVALCSVH